MPLASMMSTSVCLHGQRKWWDSPSSSISTVAESNSPSSPTVIGVLAEIYCVPRQLGIVANAIHHWAGCRDV
jgi:hypothetical protein